MQPSSKVNQRTVDGLGRVIFSVSPAEAPLTSDATSIKFVLQGSERYVTKDREYWLQEGQFALVQPETDLIGGSRRGHAVGLCLYLNGPWQGRSGDGLFAPFQTFTAYGNPIGCILIEAAARLKANRDDESALSGSLLRTIGNTLPDLASDFDTRSNRLGRVRQATRGELYRRVETARAWLHAREETAANLPDLAAAVSLSPFHLARAFKAAHGVAPMEYHARLRLDRARDLLREGASAAEVSDRLGYSEPSAFSRAFRRRWGMPPGALRATSVNVMGAAG